MMPEKNQPENDEFNFDMLEAEIFLWLSTDERAELDEVLRLMDEQQARDEASADRLAREAQMRAVCEMSGLDAGRFHSYRYVYRTTVETNEDLSYLKNRCWVFIGKTAIASAIAIGVLYQIKK